MLVFHLYLNAFANEDTIFMRESHGRHRRAKAGDKKWGGIDVTSIKVGDKELRKDAKFGADETLMTVPLPSPVAPGGTLEMAFEFKSRLLDHLLAANFHRAVDKLIGCFDDRARALYGSPAEAASKA